MYEISHSLQQEQQYKKLSTACLLACYPCLESDEFMDSWSTVNCQMSNGILKAQDELNVERGTLPRLDRGECMSVQWSNF